MELIKILIRFYETLHVQVKSLQSLRWARRLVYAWMFVNYLILSSDGSYFYSKDSYIPTKNFTDLGLFEKVFNLLHWDILQSAYPVFLVAILIFSVLAFLEKWPRASALAVYFLMINLDNKAGVILDGGNNLMHLIGFYLIFVNPRKSQSAFSTTLTNLSVLMIKIQVTFVYATAGLLKVMGPLWNKGVALYYTMGVNEYGNPFLFKLLSENAAFLALMTLGTVLFQISLPYLIWLRPWRPYVVLAGTCLHLSISFVMGLFMFGFAMCVSYSFFSEDKEGV
ncbi:hypothetical protein AZI86_08725 [Bdellovibrio bacteriovorus]|uniref:HTTM-like domain-containing protein n=1 Tax=Bdellovibrio bacteriovorus TaxID=959 RepID=A0A150WSA6_BDEBC|nr:HTTM domain-containing protein [Bdellovibrio bacteriovorus]KYG67085.1 hypothetical protein AZI86_08725 [Bdellovibrio bacteriovorus]